MNVITRLSHRGQWMQSPYPVCVVASDHRQMGGALTYARRYGLFAAAGIAGEDDLDAEPEVTALPSAGAKRAQKTLVKQLPPEPPETKPEPFAPAASASAAATMIATLSACADRKAVQDWATENRPTMARLLSDDRARVTQAWNDSQAALNAKRADKT